MRVSARVRVPVRVGERAHSSESAGASASARACKHEREPEHERERERVRACLRARLLRACVHARSLACVRVRVFFFGPFVHACGFQNARGFLGGGCWRRLLILEVFRFGRQHPL